MSLRASARALPLLPLLPDASSLLLAVVAESSLFFLKARPRSMAVVVEDDTKSNDRIMKREHLAGGDSNARFDGGVMVRVVDQRRLWQAMAMAMAMSMRIWDLLSKCVVCVLCAVTVL